MPSPLVLQVTVALWMMTESWIGPGGMLLDLRYGLIVGIVGSSFAASIPQYKVLGSVDVDTGESSIFYFKQKLYILDNIFCGFMDHFGQWDHRFANHSYARIRELHSGVVIANVTETIGTSFVSAFVDRDHDRVWLSALGVDRCVAQCGTGVLAISSLDLMSWTSSMAISDVNTCNTEIARVEQAPPTLPPHRYVMILEPFIFMLNNNVDGNLSHGWFSVRSKAPDADSGGPSLRFEDGFYYVITGGHKVYVVRSKDLQTWEPAAVMISPSAADAQAAPLANFPAEAHRKGFDTMSDPADWDWNSNDADVCCHGVDPSVGSWLIWGASTQGRAPKPPATHAQTNVVGFANVTLAELLSSFFVKTEKANDVANDVLFL